MNRTVPPYNTGKVLIGSRFERRNDYPMSDFEYRLQESLLRRTARSEAAYYLVCVMAVAALVSLVLAWA